jgi:hypothetical protein
VILHGGGARVSGARGQMSYLSPPWLEPPSFGAPDPLAPPLQTSRETIRGDLEPEQRSGSCFDDGNDVPVHSDQFEA